MRLKQTNDPKNEERGEYGEPDDEGSDGEIVCGAGNGRVCAGDTDEHVNGTNAEI
eukprot:CAMPEP_0197067688 /NCGR_PEP_ID=MMETSP1384-20130603/181905_1 /TAXON_ID=29189 /ORGANISM="Ammonia sp." /LENGTH=54 /DNA_ID=CAMNT_0042505215 /DNA_START=108 /DNA_END=272 /DNA_ORIENTATION=-